MKKHKESRHKPSLLIHTQRIRKKRKVDPDFVYTAVEEEVEENQVESGLHLQQQQRIQAKDEATPDDIVVGKLLILIYVLVFIMNFVIE